MTQGNSYRVFHEEQDMAAGDRGSHIQLIPAEPFSLRELYYKENTNKNLNLSKRGKRKTKQLKSYNVRNINLAENGIIGNFWLISLKMNLEAFIFK